MKREEEKEQRKEEGRYHHRSCGVMHLPPPTFQCIAPHPLHANSWHRPWRGGDEGGYGIGKTGGVQNCKEIFGKNRSLIYTFLSLEKNSEPLFYSTHGLKSGWTDLII